MVNIAVTVELQMKSDVVFHATFTFANAAITNIMACRAYRQLALRVKPRTPTSIIRDAAFSTDVIQTLSQPDIPGENESGSGGANP